MKSELAGYLSQFANLGAQTGYVAVVCNGRHLARLFQASIGPVGVRIPKVRSKDDTPVTFGSALVPPYVRRTKTLEATLPRLCLKEISSGEMSPALKVLLVPHAVDLLAHTMLRLKQGWVKEHEGWKEEGLDDEPIVYICANNVHSGLRGENGVSESTQSWREVLLNLKSWEMNAHKRAIGNGAMNEISPRPCQQRCWQHKKMKVLNCLLKLTQPKAKAAIHNIWQIKIKDDAQTAFDSFIRIYDPKYPKATLCLQKDRIELMAFFEFPAQHWLSIRTSSPTESAFGTSDIAACAQRAACHAMECCT